MSNVFTNNSSINVLPKSKRFGSDDNMIPLINIVFLLLIFFMVAGQIQKRPDAAIEVPSFQQTETPANLQQFVEINAEGEISLNQTSMTPQQLASVLTSKLTKELSTPESVNNDPNIALTLVVDRRVTARQLEDVLSELRPLKHVSLSMLVDQN